MKPIGCIPALYSYGGMLSWTRKICKNGVFLAYKKKARRMNIQALRGKNVDGAAVLNFTRLTEKTA